MAVATQQITRQRLSDFDTVWTQVQSWLDPAWACSTTAAPLPDKAWARALVGEAGVGVIVAREGNAGLGFVVYRTTGRILWLVAQPARFVEVADALIREVTARSTATAWGVMTADLPRTTLLDAAVVVPHSLPQYPEGTVVRGVP